MNPDWVFLVLRHIEGKSEPSPPRLAAAFNILAGDNGEMKNIRSTMLHVGAVVTGGLLLCSAPVASATIIYDVNRTIGAGTVTGFIETNGTLGVLVSTDITNWVLTLTAPNLLGGSPDVIDFATQTSTVVFGTATTATLTQLLFDFSLSGTHLLLLHGSGPNNYWCLETAGCTGAG